MATSEAKEIKKQETLVRFSIISYKTRLRVQVHGTSKKSFENRICQSTPYMLHVLYGMSCSFGTRNPLLDVYFGKLPFILSQTSWWETISRLQISSYIV